MIEIERKYLVVDSSYLSLSTCVHTLRQGYIPALGCTVRVRVWDDEAFITIKSHSADGGISRYECEVPVPIGEVDNLFTLCRDLVEKRRYIVPYGGHRFEVDVFTGRNAGLVVAEVELSSEDEAVALPRFLGREVSHLPQYRNSYLAEHPYSEWSAELREE